ncbi:MAG TPA: FAD-dependent oxidoreductase [Vicinamibacterales bacterium]|nr:FAD-dependent oxidoreductase [Vicinamibacterales bacterium]
MTAPTILVIGGGPAGTFAAISAKKHDPAAAVSLLTREACEPYEKPPLSKAVLLGRVAPEDALIAGPGGVAGHNVVLEMRADCAAIDRDDRAVVLADGRRIRFDALVLATGSAPREIPQLPVGMPRVHYLRTDADARSLKAALRDSRTLLVIGGGLIGLEVAASAAMLGVKVTVLEVAPRILSRVCDERTGAAVHAAHLRHGVDIRASTTLAAASLVSDDRIEVVTTMGERFAAGLVVVGTGSKPDTRLGEAAGLAVDDGIVVDAHCRTTDPTIFAAGDCARFPGPGGLARLENWIHAQDQGIIAGRNAAGATETYSAVPSFWSEQYDLYIQGVGWPAGDSTRVLRGLDGDRLLVFDVKESALTCAMGINAQRDLAVARRLIERRSPIDLRALADPGRPLAALSKR